jgi:hypothetical protein
VKNSSLEKTLMINIGTTREGFEKVHGVLNMANKIKREKKS